VLIKAQWVAYFESFGGDTEKQSSLRNVLCKQSNNTRADAWSMLSQFCWLQQSWHSLYQVAVCPMSPYTAKIIID